MLQGNTNTTSIVETSNGIPTSSDTNTTTDSLNNTGSTSSLDDSEQSAISGDVYDGAKSADIRELQKMLKEM